MPSPRVEYISGEVTPSITVSGLAETVAMLDELPRAIVLLGFTKAFQAAGEVFMEAVDVRVPIRLGFTDGDLTVEGGDLKAALMQEVTIDSNYRGGMVEVGFGKLGYIANFLEYGHRMLSHSGKQLSGPRSPGGFVPANPFMRPAYDGSKDQAIEAFTNSIAQTLKQYKSGNGMPAAAA